MEKYVEIAIGNISNRNQFIPYSQIYKFLAPKKEVFRSFYCFDSDIEESIKERNSIKKYYIPHLILDLDKKDKDYKILIEQVKDLTNYLIKFFNLEYNYKIFFSGSGFHIHLPNVFNIEESEHTPIILKETIEYYFKNYDIDFKIYNHRGMIRVPFSYNSKSDNYKTFISEDMLYNSSIDEILNKSKEFKIEKLSPFEKVEKTFVPVGLNGIKPSRKVSTIETSLSFQPSSITTCMQKLYMRGEIVGKRHESLLRLSSWLMRNGIPLEAALVMLNHYCPSLGEKEVKRIVSNVYNKKYIYGCDDKIMKEYCDSRCIFYVKKNYVSEIANSSQLEKFYQKFVSGGFYDAAINLKDIIPIIPEDFLLIPGNMIGLIGDTGINKSSFMQNICLHFQRYGEVLYINTEMSNIEMYERFIMIAYDEDKNFVRNHYQINNNSLSVAVKNIFYTTNTPTFDQVKEAVIRHRPKVVVIDVIDDIFTKKLTLKDEEFMYMELKDLAKKYNFILFLVHHISKKSSSTSLSKHSAKGSSAFEQKCDVILGIEGITTMRERTLVVLKGRSHPVFKINLTVKSNYKFEEIPKWQQ